MHELATHFRFRSERELTKMENIEEKLSKEVRKYAHLYDTSSPHYKDCQMAANSWREISTNIGVDVVECTKKWKNLRDKYVRLLKRMATRSEDSGGKKMSEFYSTLSWLAPHIKHRDTESSHDDSGGKKTGSSCRKRLSPPPSLLPSSPRMGQKRQRRDHDDSLQEQVARLEQRKVDLEQRLSSSSDEASRFGQTVADMLRRVPEDRRPQAMFDVFKLLFERQQHR